MQPSSFASYTRSYPEQIIQCLHNVVLKGSVLIVQDGFHIQFFGQVPHLTCIYMMDIDSSAKPSDHPSPAPIVSLTFGRLLIFELLQHSTLVNVFSILVSLQNSFQPHASSILVMTHPVFLLTILIKILYLSWTLPMVAYLSTRSTERLARWSSYPLEPQLMSTLASVEFNCLRNLCWN